MDNLSIYEVQVLGGILDNALKETLQNLPLK